MNTNEPRTAILAMLDLADGFDCKVSDSPQRQKGSSHA